jgi:hypothetical protein
MSDSWWSFGLDIGFTDHFNTQFIITRNYSAIAILHTSQFTVTHTESFLAHRVFTSSYLVMAPTMAIPLVPG